jgi:hypothetical protein
MKLTASIKRPIAGTPVERRLYLDGNEVQVGHTLSRKLTDTTDEGGCGIFSDENTMYRKDLSVSMKFNGNLEMRNFSDAQAFLDEVMRRADSVRAAFIEKYPVHDSQGVVERNSTPTVGVPLPTKQEPFN